MKTQKRRREAQALLGRRLCQLRRLAGVTQAEVATRAGVETKYYGSVERGERNVSLETLERLARAFEREPYELIVPIGARPNVPETVSRRELETLIRGLSESRLRLIAAIMASVAECLGNDHRGPR